MKRNETEAISRGGSSGGCAKAACKSTVEEFRDVPCCSRDSSLIISFIFLSRLFPSILWDSVYVVLRVPTPSPLDLAMAIYPFQNRDVVSDRVSSASVYAPYRHSFVYLKFLQILGNLVRCAKGTQRRIRSIAEQTFAAPSVHAWTISLPVSGAWWRWPGGCDGGSERYGECGEIWCGWLDQWVALGWRVRRRVQAKLHY